MIIYLIIYIYICIYRVDVQSIKAFARITSIKIKMEGGVHMPFKIQKATPSPYLLLLACPWESASEK